MKHYPEIRYYGDYWGLPIMAFNKLDGSNLRFEYSQKRGFYKFGTRKQIIDSNSIPFGFAVNLFLQKYSEGLTAVMKSKKYRNTLSAVFFAELHGSKSEFGQHEFDTDSFDITLFDVSLYKKGLLAPREFVTDFQHLGIAEVVYDGNLNRELVMRIRSNEFGLREGVVCKGIIPNRKGDILYYCKIKTNEWFDRLRNRFPQEYQKEIREVSDENI